MRWTRHSDRQPRWERWFAWYPVRLSGNNHRVWEMVWLEWVERYWEGYFDQGWKYR